MSVGRFIFLCEPEHFIVAGKAIKALQDRPTLKDILISQGDEANEVMMYAKRLRGSIRVQQVKP